MTLLNPLVTVAVASRPYRQIERHVFTETHAGATSLCRDVQYSARLVDGLAPFCQLCRAGALAAIAVTGSLLQLGGLDRLTLNLPVDDMAPGELVEMYGK